MVWVVQAVTEPPSNVFCTKQGEVVVNKAPGKKATKAIPATHVASNQTLKLCSIDQNIAEGNVDPLFRNDPWAKSVMKTSLPHNAVPDPSASLKQIEERIEKAVLSKIPSKVPAPMEIDSCNDHSEYDQRLTTLEHQMQRLTNNQQQLDFKVDEAQRKNEAQFTQLQNQVSSRIDQQSSQIEELFKGQLAQIESLLGKRARME